MTTPSLASRIALGLCLALLAAAAYVAWLLTSYEAPPVDPSWQIEAARDVPAGAVTVRHSGTATLVFSDGETTWMTDGWFTRPGPFDLLFGEIAPDAAAIERGLARLEVRDAAAVFPVHSHYDHAMDAPEVAKRTGALLLGSESTANIGRGAGLDESRIRVVADRQPIAIGRFVVTPIESRHFEFPDPAVRERALGTPDITEPLVPPAATFDYRVGTAWVLHVAHPRGTWLIVGSAGYVPGGLAGFEADTVFLGVGGLGSQSDDYRETFWRETAGLTKVSRVIPIHWDSLIGPMEGPFTGELRAARFLSAGSDALRAFLDAKARAHPEVAFATLPRFEPVVLY